MKDIKELAVGTTVHSARLAIQACRRGLANWFGIMLIEVRSDPIEFKAGYALKKSWHALRFIDRWEMPATKDQASPRMIADLAKADA